jgi:beta-glucuronidase
MNRKSYYIISFLVLALGTFTFAKINIDKDSVKEPNGKIYVAQSKSGHWQLMVNNRPYIVKGVEYSPDAVSSNPKESNEWMNDDYDSNARCDGPYDSWIDANRNNKRDPNENAVGDFQLLKEMGCNTVRIYHPDNINKKILRDLYENYGIRVIMGHLFGAYNVGSGAEWPQTTDYTDEKHRQNILADVKKMVQEYKDEPYILMWMLGNENDMVGSYESSEHGKVDIKQVSKEYAKLVNEAVLTIKSIDPNHPVGVCNALYTLLPYYKKYAPEIDIIGMNAYKGAYGFGTLWNRVKISFDRPVLITEYGTDCYNQVKDEIDEDFQAKYHKRAWSDILRNSYGSKIGNAIGGVVYCWLDKWWLCGSEKVHDKSTGAWNGPTIDSWMNDEWMGICGQGNGKESPFIRQPRQVYYTYKNELWNK